jgi:hypothetical protein
LISILVDGDACLGEARPAQPVKSVRRTDLSAERREPKRAAGE